MSLLIAPSHSDSDGERLVVGGTCRTCQGRKASLHGALAGSPSVTAARTLLAPHFLDPGFLGLNVGLAYREKGGCPCPTPSICSSRPPPLLLILTFFTGLLSLRLDLELGGGGAGRREWVGRRECSA